MKSIIMIHDLKDATSANIIQQTLESSSIEYELNLERKIVIVDGNNDKIRLAKQLIANAGFQVL